MARPILDWITVDPDTSHPDISKAYKAELMAQENTDAVIRKLAALQTGLPADQIRIGRNFGKLSFAHDPARSAKATVALTGKLAKD